jgi:hypothetical protein
VLCLDAECVRVLRAGEAALCPHTVSLADQLDGRHSQENLTAFSSYKEGAFNAIVK